MPLPGAGCPWQCWLKESRVVAACQAMLRAALLEADPGASSAAAQQLLRVLCHAAPGCGMATMLPGLGSHCLMPCIPLQDVLNSKNATIKDLQLQLARVCKVREGAGGLLDGGCGFRGVEKGPSAPGCAQSGGKGTHSRLLHALGQAGPSPGCNFPCEGRHVGVIPPTMQGVQEVACAQVWRGWDGAGFGADQGGISLAGTQ